MAKQPLFPHIPKRKALLYPHVTGRNKESSADYWNRLLEHNDLRSPAHGKGPDTDAGAFLAWHLEAVGDIIRELVKKDSADPNYIFEKFNRLKNHLTDRDWTDPLSTRENTALVKIKEDIEGLPADTQLMRELKLMLLAIANRQPRVIEGNLDSLRSFLLLQEAGERIAKQLGNGIIYNGPQMYNSEFYAHLFTDIAVTGTTFACIDLEKCKENLIQNRKAFKAAPPVFPKTERYPESILVTPEYRSLLSWVNEPLPKDAY